LNGDAVVPHNWLIQASRHAKVHGSGMNLMLSAPDMANIEKGLERIERFCQG